MNRITTTTLATAETHAVAVAGSDIDHSLLRALVQGDKVMMEVNGVRIYNDNRCPLVSNEPWEVLSNDAPTMGQRPTEEHKLVLTHPQARKPVELSYSNLLLLPRRQPAVFQEKIPQFSTNPDGSVNPVYIILQLISHYIPCGEVNQTFEPYDVKAARLVLSDDDFREVVLSEWASLFATFKKPGWGQKSVFRLALRAFVSPSEIDAIIRGRGDQLDMQAIFRIHESLHWLPYYIEQSPLAIQRDTIDVEA